MCVYVCVCMCVCVCACVCVCFICGLQLTCTQVNKNTVLTYMASMPPGVTLSDLTEFFCCSNEEVQQVMQGLETEFIIFCKNGRFHFL